MNNRASVIVPVYNQIESCFNVMNAFSKQDVSTDCYEIILIDDGSTDGLEQLCDEKLKECFNIDIRIIHCPRGGRAKARNVGIKNARNDIIIFCDGDRVPGFDFISKHIEANKEEDAVIIGASLDYFGNKKYVNQLDWDMLECFSRKAPFLKKVETFYKNNRNVCEMENKWLTLLIGNSSMLKCKLVEVGGFNQVFEKWGFEHFELGIRLAENGCRFKYFDDIRNYHLPHKREEGFYEKAIKENLIILSALYPKKDFGNVFDILLGDEMI